jgi:hypothetical protein
MASDEAEFGDVEAMAELKSAGKDSRWSLTGQEMTWAKELKAALSKQGVEPPASDFELAHFAIVSKGDLKKGVKRVSNYNKLIKPLYSYTMEEGLRTIGFMNRKWPGCLLTCGKAPNGSPIVCCDVNPYLPGQLKKPSTPEGEAEWKEMMLELVLLFHCSASNLDECRSGMTFITQCKGMGWKNFSLELEHRAAVLYQDAIPCRFAGMPCVNAGPILRVMLALCKVFLKKKIADRIIVCKQADLITKHSFAPESLPALLGGTCEKPTYEEWCRAQLVAREESKQKVWIDIEPVDPQLD